LLSISTNAFAQNTDVTANINLKQEEKDTEIGELMDERLDILSQDSVDNSKLNEIDLQLEKLGIEFLTLNEVQKRFPETKSFNYSASDSDASVNVNPPSSAYNTWMLQRVSNWYYNGQYYNIQKLVAQPTSENSKLWTEGGRAVNYSIDWKAGVTNFIQSVASTLAGESVYAPAITVYDALSSVWSGLSPVSEIKPSKVTYTYETQTTAAFQYVRLEKESDSYQRLSHISTKCKTSLGYLVDVDSWRQNSSGTWIPDPDIRSGSRTIYNTPNLYNDSGKAVYSYSVVRALNDSVSSITISGPESKTVQNIYPLYPSFPLDCE
jgi:hypothetical protein